MVQPFFVSFVYECQIVDGKVFEFDQVKRILATYCLLKSNCVSSSRYLWISKMHDKSQWEIFLFSRGEVALDRTFGEIVIIC